MALLANPASKVLLKKVAFNFGLAIVEKVSSYFLERIKESGDSRNSTAKHEEGICPICQEKLKLDYLRKPKGEQKDDIEFGIFMLQSCEHKFHYRCLQRFRLICKDCPVCSL